MPAVAVIWTIKNELAQCGLTTERLLKNSDFGGAQRFSAVTKTL